MNKDLKDRNDELEINLQILPKSSKTKKCEKCHILSSNDPEKNDLKYLELDDECTRLHFLFKVCHV